MARAFNLKGRKVRFKRYSVRNAKKLPKNKCVQLVAERKVVIGSMHYRKRGKAWELVGCPTLNRWRDPAIYKREACKGGFVVLQKVKAKRGKACPTKYQTPKHKQWR